MSKQTYIKNIIDDLEHYFRKNHPSYTILKTDNSIEVENHIAKYGGDRSLNGQFLTSTKKNLAFAFDKEIFDVLKASSDDINYWTTFKSNIVNNKLTII